ncbi:MAG TPA: hypothetical protein VL180_04990 [Burkholderiales bacterium]|jgi:hypothetical protein|nr:hypothetical protein [Burkholderiales bacterium]
MNPELRRHLWLEFSAHRLIATPALIALVALLVVAISDGYGLRPIAIAAAYGFMGLVMLWGTHNAAESMLEEVRNRTWDTQRMSSIEPWTMTWGKLAGATAFTWYGGAICLVLFIVTGAGRLEIAVLKTAAVMLGGALLLHAVALNLALIGAQRGVAPRSPGGIVFFLLVLTLLGPSIGFVTEAKGAVLWWGLQFPHIDFVLASVIVFAVWAAFGAYRSMCSELQARKIPWAIPAFLGFMALYLAGFLAFKERTLGPVEAVLACGLGVSLIVEYLLLFSERTGPMTLRRLMARAERSQWRRALEELPGWPIAFAVALLCAIGMFLVVGAASDGVLYKTRAAGIGVALFALRDAALLHIFAFARQPKRVEAVTLLYLALLYWLIPALLDAMGAESLARLVLPNVFAEKPGLAIAAIAVQSAIAVAIAALRWRRNYSAR